MQENFPKDAELPSAADLDLVAEEQKIREATNGKATLADMADLRSYVIDARTGPTPQQIDEVIADYSTAITIRSASAADEKEAKQVLLTLVRVFGHPSAGSEHSHIIKGALHTAMVTDVTTLGLHEDRVLALRTLLADNSCLDVFNRLFSTRLKHELVTGAEQALQTADMPKWLRAKAQAAFGLCMKTSDSAPRVKVELLAKEPKQPRKRAAKKAVQG